MGLLKTAAKVAVASSVHGRVQRRQQQRWAAQDLPHAPPPPPPPPPPPSASSPADTLEQLAKLGDLKAAGVLNDEEFEAQKARILAG